MKKSKIAKYLIIFSLFLVIGACKKSFLDVNPQGQTSVVTFYDSFSKVDQSVTAAYSILNTILIFDVYNVLYFGNIASDDAECGGESSSDQTGAHLIDRMESQSGFNYFHEFWGTCYDGLRMANTSLNYLNQMNTIDPDFLKSNPAMVKQRIGECKFLRAFYHFQLSQVFGGVVIASDVIGPTQFSTPRRSLKETYDFIISDLRAAIPDLAPRDSVNNPLNLGRATSGAASALLAKVYLYQSSFAENYPGAITNTNPFGGMVAHYDSAKIFAENVIGSGKYNLIGMSGERFKTWRSDTTGGYSYIFTAGADNCSENIFEIESVEDKLGYEKTRGNYLTVYSTCRFYRNTADVAALGTQSPFLAINDHSTGGWGFSDPSRYLIYAFANNDTRETNLHSDQLDSAQASLDPRYSTTVGLTGDPIQVTDGSEGLGWYQYDVHNIPSHSACRKFECSSAEYWNGNSGLSGWQDEGPFDVRVIRYADVVLMAAEAEFKTGDVGDALTHVNWIRTRARMSGNTGYPKDLPTLSFEDIMHERRLELALEGHRFFDLVRWGKAYDFINGITIDATPGAPVVFTKGKNELFPIPVQDIQLTGIKQNNGY